MLPRRRRWTPTSLRLRPDRASSVPVGRRADDVHADAHRHHTSSRGPRDAAWLENGGMAFSHDAPPLPGRAVIAQRWSRALFLHWRADAARLAPLLPPGVRPDVFDGSGWIGL